MRRWLRSVIGVGLALAIAAPASAEVSELRITKQPSIIYLPLVVMEQNKLLEKHAKAAGLGDLKVSWITFNSGGASTDALLSGSVDLVTSGVSNLLLLWERTKGEVNGVTSVGGLPMLLVTRDPAVKTLKDFTEKDKIAVPTIKVSSQAMVLKMAMEKMYGEAARDKLDAMTVQLGPSRRDDRRGRGKQRGQQSLFGAAVSVHRAQSAGRASGARLERCLRRPGEQCRRLRNPQVLRRESEDDRRVHGRAGGGERG